MGDFILLRKNKRKNRKRGKISFAWLVSYIASEITPKVVITLKKRDSEILKVKHTLSQVQLYLKEKTASTGGGTIEFTVAVDNEKPSTSVNTGTSTPLDCN